MGGGGDGHDRCDRIVAVLDISVVNVALPHMMGNFGVSQSEVTWVATSYSIAEIIMVTMTGWWTALLGRKRMLLLSFGVFTAGSVLCGMAGTFTQMLLYRVLQGIGGGALIPLSQAILRETFPREQQGTAMALYGMGVVLAPAAGPVLGGWLTDGYGSIYRSASWACSWSAPSSKIRNTCAAASRGSTGPASAC